MPDSLLPPSIRDERFLALEQILERLTDIDLSAIRVYDIDNVTAGALFDLAEQLNVAGIRGWNLATTEQQRRDLVKNAIALHRVAGTPYSVRRALALVGYENATILENPGLYYDGSWDYDGTETYRGAFLGGFIVTLDPEYAKLDTQSIELVVSLINEWKNARSQLLDLRIGNLSLFSNLLFYNGTWYYTGSQNYDAELNV